MQVIKIDLRNSDELVAKDAIDELTALGLALPADADQADKDLVWKVLNSRIARKVQQYDEQGPQVQIVPPQNPPQPEG